MSFLNFRSAKVTVHSPSSRQRPVHNSSKASLPGDNLKQEKDGIREENGRNTKLKEGSDQGRLYFAEYAGGTEVTLRRENDSKFSSAENHEIGQGKVHALENGVYVQSPKKVLDAENGVEVANGDAKSQSNGQDYGTKIEHLQLRNKGFGVLEASKGYAADIRRSLFHMKERLMDKLAAVPIPAEALDNARQSVETAIKDMTHTAQGMTKDAMQRIKGRLVEILPSLSPHHTGKIVHDAEREVLGISQVAAPGFASRIEGKNSLEEFNKKEIQHEEGIPPSKASIISPALPFSIKMARLKRSFSPRSRL